MVERSGVHSWLILWRATRAVEVVARRSVAETGLCLSDFGVLEALLHKGPLPVTALGKRVLLTSGSMTAAVDRLEAGRLVRRQGAPDDRRSRLVHLTPEGESLIRRAFEGHAQDMERAFASLEAEERDILEGLLRKLGHAAEALELVSQG
jgi:MarR family 2-MHQ and catechol resistance regulon transcriptional repressor